MKQVFFDGKGKLLVKDVPAPVAAPEEVLVRVEYSLISAGTESTAATGSGSVLRRLLKQPQLIGSALRLARQQGIWSMLRTAREVVDTWTPTGYSAAGTVIAVGAAVRDIKVGEKVACAGYGLANHAEFVAVPQNLTVPLPAGIDTRAASFATLGAIALQGVRRANPTLGETVVVIGSGLIGLLTAQLLLANGCQVVCTDLSAERLALAGELGVQQVFQPGQGDLTAAVLAVTGGHGADAVIITAGTRSSEPVNSAFKLCRERGRVVLVGAVGMELERPTLYVKELDVLMSRSYGPGRHDPHYEEQNVDYPIGYVRWTERRNLAAFLQLVADGRVDVARLTSKEYLIEQAEAAYAQLLSGDPSVIGVVLRYPGDQPLQTELNLPTAAPAQTGTVGVALVGTGNFARLMHIPNLKALPNVSAPVVVSGSGGSARQAAEALGASVAATELDAALMHPQVQALLISTRHNLHAAQSIAAAKAGKHIFVEKPLALTLDDCRAVEQAVAEAGVLCTVGFNRRFAPLMQALFASISKTAGPRQIVIRVNAGPLAATHWLRDPQVGGGRIVGEGCHFFDLLVWLAQSAPVAVSAQQLGSDPDDLSAVVRFANGSVGTLVYSGLGSAQSSKERYEVLAGGGVAVLDDFRTLTLTGLPGRDQTARRPDKGHKALLANFVDAVQGKTELAITARDGTLATQLALAALESARSGLTVAL